MPAPARRSNARGSSFPELPILHFPAWDCLPYDRVSPRSDIESQRLATLAALAKRNEKSGAALVVTTINALVQRVPPRESIAGASFFAKVGAEIALEELIRFLSRNAYSRTGTVREPGEYAPRGGILDLWPPGQEEPLRLDFFGPQLEAIRRFDAESQRTSGTQDSVALLPATETPLDAEAISRFRAGYVAAFGAVTDDDPLYEAISAGRKHAGQEHWLPLFHARLDTLFDYTGRAVGLPRAADRGGAESAARADRRLLRDAQILAHRQEGRRARRSPRPTSR